MQTILFFPNKLNLVIDKALEQKAEVFEPCVNGQT
jgi:hypothetical protein